jgi:hypothetical protein
MLKAHGPSTARVSSCTPVNSPNLSFSLTLSAANTPGSLAIISSSLLWGFAASLHAPFSKTSTSPSHCRNRKTLAHLEPPSSEHCVSSINIWPAAPARWSAGRLRLAQTTITTPPPAPKSQPGADNHHGRLPTRKKWKDTALGAAVAISAFSATSFSRRGFLRTDRRFFPAASSVPRHFRATIYGVYLLTGTTGGSTLSIPGSLQSSFFREATTERSRG